MKQDKALKKQKISEIIGNIDEKYIKEAVTYEKAAENQPRVEKSRKKLSLKWLTAAACLVLVLSVGMPLGNLLSPDKNTSDTVLMIIYENAYYEVIEDNPETLRKRGIETKVTAELAGEHIVYLNHEIPGDDRSGYIISDEKTDFELLTYKDADCRAVRVLRRGDKYNIVILCNYIVPENESMPIRDFFEIFGIESETDIKSICASSSDNTWKPVGDKITDKNAIAEFYSEALSLTSYSEDEHHDLVFAEDLKDAEDVGGGDVGDEVYTKYADDIHTLLIETKEGLRFKVDYFPSYGWMHFSQTMSYAQISDALSAWVRENIK